MMKHPFIFILCFFLISCSDDNTIKNTVPPDSARVYLAPQKDTLPLTGRETDSLHSEITCPKCGFKKTELLPTEVCLLRYTCKTCGYEMTPDEDDCCVFCTYGNVKCPSMQ